FRSRVAAILDDEGLSRVAPHIGQRLGQGAHRAQPMLGFGEVRLCHGRGLYPNSVGRASIAPVLVVSAAHPGRYSGVASAARAARSSAMPSPEWALVARISGCAAVCRAISSAVAARIAASGPGFTLSILVRTIW